MERKRGFISTILLIIIILVILYLYGWDVREVLQDIVDVIYKIVVTIADFFRDLLN
jgi:hypothetical protein